MYKVILLNISNGLVYQRNYKNEDIDFCYFQSSYGHHAETGYFNDNSMPFRAIIHLLQGGSITIIDATRRHKLLTDGLKWGVGTWCMVFNRAIWQRNIITCQWQTKEMKRIAYHSKIHDKLKHTIRKLDKYFGHKKPAVIGDNIKLICHQGFIADDKPERLKKLLIKSAKINKTNDFAIFINENPNLIH